jgi:AcrR family transcriptional regulator
MTYVDERGGGALEEVRAGVVQRLRAVRVEIDDAIFARVFDLAPGAAGLADPEYVTGLRTAVAAVVDYGLTGIEQGEEFGAVVPSAALAQVRRAARAGVGLDTVLRRYVAGYAVLEDYVMREADRSAFVGQRTAVRHVLETSASLLDRLIPSIAGAYSQELERARSAHRAPAPQRRDHGFRVAEGRTPRASREQVVRDQRARIKRALVEVLAEHGFAGATIGLVVGRARVSTRTFYEHFDGLEECLIAIMDGVLEQAVTLASLELQDAECWQDGVRSALAAVLSYFDREPELARVCMVETLAGGSVVLAHRERLIEAFRLPVVERIESEAPQVSPLAAEGVMSLVLGIMHAHIVERKPGPFIELLGPLIGLTMAPYLGAQGVRREIEQGDQLARTILNEDPRWFPPAEAPRQDTELGAQLDATLLPELGSAITPRARECLLFLAEHPDSSNREVAVGIAIAHRSQVSKLLAYLLQENLVTKRSEGRGMRNAWRLTPRVQEMVTKGSWFPSVGTGFSGE